ncbi:MAG: hypothetical protein D6720_07165 [Gammaproteobacteria bacterium]|nr:MAG: hypothetical protein D6720_07165 [Gammaproteobacteria bacterium]
MNMTTADALRLYHEMDLPETSTGMEPLDAETLENLRLVEGYANPLDLATQLTAALRTLWVARKSGELADDDADSTIWLLGEVSNLIEHAIEAQHGAEWWQRQHEKALAEAEQAKPAPRRRKTKEGEA